MLFTTRQRYTSWKCDSGQKDCSQNFIQIVPSDSKPPEITSQLVPNVRRANPIRHYRKQLIPTHGSGSRGANVSHINRPGGSVLLHKESSNPDKKCCDPSSNSSHSIQTYLPLEQEVLAGKRINDCDCNSVCVPSCNHESRIIKSSIALLNKNYYAGTHAYLQSRCKTFRQKSITLKKNDIDYLTPTGEVKQPTDSPTGSQVFKPGECCCSCCCDSSIKNIMVNTTLSPPSTLLAITSIPDNLNNLCINQSLIITNQSPHRGQIAITTSLPSTLSLTNAEWDEYINDKGITKIVGYPSPLYDTDTFKLPCSCEIYFLVARHPASLPTSLSLVIYKSFTIKSCDCQIPCSNTTIYKPNNTPFTQQGAVSGGARIAKLKYDTVTKNGNSFRSAYGAQEANTGKYKPDNGASYFVKTKILPYCRGSRCQNSQCTRHRNGNRTLCFSMTK